MIHTCTIAYRPTAVLGTALVFCALGCREDTSPPTSPMLEPAIEDSPAMAFSFRQVSAGKTHTCGVTTANQAYCWGRNDFGQLGDGTTNGSLTPVAVSGELSFRQVSAGSFHTCGVTAENLAYCWGRNFGGALGIGTLDGRSLIPLPVAGGLQFRQVSAGLTRFDRTHSCGVTTDDKAYCWGYNDSGQLGDGTVTGHYAPVPVAGRYRFLRVTTGARHSCAVDYSDRVYCWGENSSGQLGDGTITFERQTPVAVAGGLRFRQVSAGDSHTCGATTDQRGYCWGSNASGQIGDGTFTRRPRPVPVAGGRTFRQLSAGSSHTCGVNPFDRAFCWGANGRGQLGDGTTAQRLTPVRVVGGLLFRQVSASEIRHTCGATRGNLAYCWGQNDNGELGDGTLSERRRPNPVAGVTPTTDAAGPS